MAHQLIHTLQSPACATLQNIYSISWSPSGNYLATGSYDGQVYIWAMHTGGTLARSFKVRCAVRCTACKCHRASLGSSVCFMAATVTREDILPSQNTLP